MKRLFAPATLTIAYALATISLPVLAASPAGRSANAGEAPSRPAQTAPSGDKALDEFLAAKNGKIGVYAIRLRDGAVLASHDATVPMAPGSVEKVATSAVALAVLGQDFQFTTTFAVLGKDLVVVGDGDPTFGDPLLAEARKGTIYDEFDEWAQKLKAAGVTSVAGDLVLDDSLISAGRHEDWPENQLQTWYCAPVGGLNFNDNCVDVRETVSGNTVVPAVTPATRFMPVVNELKVGPKDLWGVKYAPDDGQVIVTGQVRRSSGEG